MIAIGSDHGGFELKEAIKTYLENSKIQYEDFGCYNGESCDYPDIAKNVCEAVTHGNADKAFLLCGTGIGISIAANKVSGIRAACCSDYFSAKYTRLHNDANILCMGGRVVGVGLALEMVEIFLNTEFEGGRHQDRLNKISVMEHKKI